MNAHPAVLVKKGMLKTKDLILDDKATSTTCQSLQSNLYDLLSLSQITKQCHWNVQGSHFMQLHLQLDKLYHFLEEAADEVAERMSTLNVSPTGQAREIAAETKIEQVPKGFLKDSHVVDLMTDRLSTACAKIRERTLRIEDADPVSFDMLINLLESLEKHLWMLRVQQA